MLRILTAEGLEIDFQVDITVAVAEAESSAIKPDIEKIEEALVTRVFEAVKSDDLKKDLKEATNEEIAVVVMVEPKKEIVVFIDTGVAAENAEELHDQPEEGALDHHWNCAMEGTDVVGCLHVYVPAAFFVFALLCMVSACCVKTFSKSERHRAALKKHTKAQSRRSGREWDMPKIGGTRDSEFSDDQSFQAINPMANPAGAEALKNFRPGRGPKSAAAMAVDDFKPAQVAAHRRSTASSGGGGGGRGGVAQNEGTRPPGRPPPSAKRRDEWKEEKTEEGDVYYINQTTGESRWDKP